MRVQRRLAVLVVVGEPPGAAVAACAHVHLAGRGARGAPLCVARRGDARPRDALALVQRDRQTLVAAGAAPGGAARLRPGDVARAGTVTGLAGDVELRPCRLERSGPGVEVLPQIRRVALGALIVPVLVDAGPMQRIAGLDAAPRIQMEPAPPARGLRPRVPGDAQCLQAPARQLDQVLLQRGDAERVLDLVVGGPAVRTVGVHQEPAVAPEELRRRSAVPERGVVEVAEHGLVAGDLHGEIVVRAAPGRVFLPMAFGAGGAPGKLRRRRHRCRRGGGASVRLGAAGSPVGDVRDRGSRECDCGRDGDDAQSRRIASGGR